MKAKTRIASRREFIQSVGGAAAAAVLAGNAIPRVHAAENNTIQLALIGCGGRGTGAARDALSVAQGPVKLVAMADAFPEKVSTAYNRLAEPCGDRMDVPAERRFTGLDAYRHAMDCLRPGDIAIFATPLAFRWVHFAYAVEKGLNVFMEKPLTADGPTSRRMIDIAEQATAKNLKVAVGLMARHCRPLQQLADLVHNGAMGEVSLLRGYRMHGPIVGFNTAKPQAMNEVEFQIRAFHSFLWASGGIFSDFYIHTIDHLCWLKDAWPVKAQALGARQYQKTPDGVPYIDQNFDTYSAEYTFADGAKLIMDGRAIPGCDPVYHSFAQGTKGMAVVSQNDIGGSCTIYDKLQPETAKVLHKCKGNPEETNAYANEWNDLVDAIRQDRPYNEAKRGVEASLVTSMGRMSAHMGRAVTYQELIESDDEYAPNLDRLTFDGPAPLPPNGDGTYPVPRPGISLKREFC